jgi:hypothetical protein
MTKPDSKLSVEQLNAIDILVAGKTDGEVAETVGVTRQTVCGWRNEHPAFAAALNRRRRELWGAEADRLRALVSKAVDALGLALEAEDRRVQVAAALGVLKAVGLYGLPAPAEPTTAEGVEERWSLEQLCS